MKIFFFLIQLFSKHVQDKRKIYGPLKETCRQQEEDHSWCFCVQTSKQKFEGEEKQASGEGEEGKWKLAGGDSVVRRRKSSKLQEAAVISPNTSNMEEKRPNVVMLLLLLLAGHENIEGNKIYSHWIFISSESLVRKPTTAKCAAVYRGSRVKGRVGEPMDGNGALGGSSQTDRKNTPGRDTLGQAGGGASSKPLPACFSRSPLWRRCTFTAGDVTVTDTLGRVWRSSHSRSRFTSSIKVQDQHHIIHI